MVRLDTTDGQMKVPVRRLLFRDSSHLVKIRKGPYLETVNLGKMTRCKGRETPLKHLKLRKHQPSLAMQSTSPENSDNSSATGQMLNEVKRHLLCTFGYDGHISEKNDADYLYLSLIHI